MNLSSRDRKLLGIVPVLVLCGVFYFLVLTPQRKSAAHLQTQISAAQTQLTSAQEAWEAGHAAATQLARDGSQYSAARVAVPQTSNIPAMLRLLQRGADQAGVSIQTISLSGNADSGPTDGVNAVPVTLTLGGGYQAVNRLVQRLDRYVVVSRTGLRADGPLFGISQISETPGTGKGIDISLTATIYQYASATTVEGQNSGGSS